MSKQIYKSLYTDNYVNNYQLVVGNVDEDKLLKVIDIFILHEPDLSVIPFLSKLYEYSDTEVLNLYTIMEQLSYDRAYINNIVNDEGVAICFQTILDMLYSTKNWILNYKNPMLLIDDTGKLIEKPQISSSKTQRRGKKVYKKKVKEIIEYVDEFVARINVGNRSILVPNVHNQNYDLFYFMIDVLGVDKTRLSGAYELQINIEDYVLKTLKQYPTLFNKYTFDDIQSLKELGLYGIAVIAEFFKSSLVKFGGNNRVESTNDITAIGASSLKNEDLYNLGITDVNSTTYIIHDKLLGNEDVVRELFNDEAINNEEDNVIVAYRHTNIESYWITGIIELLNNSYNRKYLDSIPSHSDIGVMYWMLVNIQFDKTLPFIDLVDYLNDKIGYYSISPFSTHDTLQNLIDVYEDLISQDKLKKINDEQAEEIFAMITTLTDVEYDTDTHYIIKIVELFSNNKYYYEAAILDSYVRSTVEHSED